jgi:hypothetical protein
MSHAIRTEITIDAPAETVWSVLTDFAAYPEWNGYTRIEGAAREGARLAVSPGPEAGRMPTFRPEVLRAGPTSEDDFELAWLGHLYIRGLFDGEHSFRVEAVDAERSQLVQSESFSGVLAGLLLRFVGDDTASNFEAVNAALKARAESLAANPSTKRDAGSDTTVAA